MHRIGYLRWRAARLEKTKPKKAGARSYGPKGRRNVSNKRIFLKRFLRWEMLIVAAALLCDLNSWGHQFVKDDTSYIAGNLFIQNPRNAFRIFLKPLVPVPLAVGHMYRPMTALSLGANCWIHGLDPDAFHAVNRLIHVMISVGIFWVLRRLLATPSAALLTALLFAVHPIQTEAVTYIEGRSDALAMLFFVFGWLLHICARCSDEKKGRFFAAAWVFYLFSMMSKESGITWIAVVALTELVYFSKGSLAAFLVNLRRDLWKVFTLYLGAPLLFIALRALALKSMVQVPPLLIDNPLAHAPLLVRELTALKILFQSVGLLLWPVRLSADYSYNQIPLVTQWSSPSGILVIAASLACCLLLGWSYFRARDVFFGLGYFLATYSVVSNLVIPIGTIRADRLLYMPSLGILWIAGVLFAGLDRQIQKARLRQAFRYAVAAVMVLLAVRTVRRNGDWQDDGAIAFQTVQTSPNSSRAHHNLGSTYFARGEFVPALEQYRIAESIYAEDPGLLNDLGAVLSRLGRDEEAIRCYRRAIDLAPLYPVIRYNLARTLRARGDVAGAEVQEKAIIAFYDDLIREDPASADHHYYKAEALISQGQFEQALSECRQTLQIDPSYSAARTCIDLITRKSPAGP
jgi:hypothetical protein